MHRAVAALPALVFFTTNYDDLLERALTDVHGVPPDVIIEDAHVGLIDEARRTTVVKMHGDLTVPDMIVLTREDYEGYAERHPAMIAYLQSHLAMRTFLFVGFSLRDTNFRQISRQIRQALGAFARSAYVLDGTEKESLIAKHWANRGVTTLPFPDFDAVRAKLQQLAVGAALHGNAVQAAQRLGASELPPPLQVQQQVQQVVSQIHDLRTSLVALFDLVGLTGAFTEVAPDAAQAAPGATAMEREWVREKGAALLQLAEAVDRLEQIDEAGFWIALGTLFFQQGDAPNAIASYHNALRPNAAGTTMKPETWRWAYGNLARAHLAEEEYARAEWLLCRCVFQPGRETPVGRPTRSSVLDRLDQQHLAQRPMDAAEFAYAVSRQVERLLEKGHPVEASEALREARYVLIVLLGAGNGVKVPNPADFFRCDATVSSPVGRWLGGGQALPLRPRAWAFNFLGKCYRLCCETALASGKTHRLKDDYERAVRYLRWASAGDPILPCGDRFLKYPYAHRALLHEKVQMPEDDDYPVLLDELRMLRKEPEGEATVETLVHRFRHSPTT